MENLGKAPFYIATIGMRLTAYKTFCFIPLQKEWMGKQIGVLRVVDQPHNLQIFSSVGKLLRKNQSGQNVAALSGEWKKANIRI
jgi:hypothetical protein